MAIPARPATGAPVATDWGQGTHDRVYLPKGCIANSAVIAGLGTVVTILPLTVGGPNLSGGAFVAPEAGVYRYSASMAASPLGGAANIRLYAYVGGVAVPGTGVWVTTGGTAGTGATISGMVNLAAGQTLDFRTSGGSGTSGMSATLWAQVNKCGDSIV